MRRSTGNGVAGGRFRGLQLAAAIIMDVALASDPPVASLWP